MTPKLDRLLAIDCKLPPTLLPWLLCEGSLTERLYQKAGHTRLQVLAQRWVPANWWDRHVLHIKTEKVTHREILMWAGDDACWYARTIIPETTFQSDPSFFNRLQHESLGNLIFNEPKINRILMTHYPINEQSIEYHWLNQFMHDGEKELWVRMSAFEFKEKNAFFLIETMLPALNRYPN